jgi:hypothetical protein
MAFIVFGYKASNKPLLLFITRTHHLVVYIYIISLKEWHRIAKHQNLMNRFYLKK